MKPQLFLYVILFLLVGLGGCRSDRKIGAQGIIDGKENGAEQSIVGSGHTAIGPFHWSIDQASFLRLSDGWINALTVNGQPMLGGMLIKSDGIQPTFDKNGFLIKIRINFRSFNIHPETDYAEEETLKLQQSCVEKNEKLLDLIELLSSTYGNPTQKQIAKDNISLYFEEGVKLLCTWITPDTRVELKADNMLFAPKYGCKTNFWLELTKND